MKPVMGADVDVDEFAEQLHALADALQSGEAAMQSLSVSEDVGAETWVSGELSLTYCVEVSELLVRPTFRRERWDGDLSDESPESA